jgi:hypothetical protein
VPETLRLAVTENVAEPDEAVWFDGCDEIVIVGVGGVQVVHVVPLLLEYCTA